MRSVIVIQARIGSTRLPQKVLLPLSGKAMLWHIVKRCQQVSNIADIVVATSLVVADLQIVEFCKSNRINVFLGDEDDVLLRFVGAATQYQADIIIRVTGDNPLICPKFMSNALELLVNRKLDYVSVANCPLGTGTEVFTYQALQAAHVQGKQRYHREHVTPYIYENQDKFKTAKYLPDVSFQKPSLRLTVDEVSDYLLMQKIYNALYQENEIILLSDVMALLEAESDLCFLNKNVKQKTYKE